MESIDFSCNINPLGPPKGLLGRIDLEKLVSSYPDHTNRKAIRSLSEHYALSEENLAVGGGSTEFFFTIPCALNIAAGVLATPTFWEYEASLKRVKKKVMYFKTHAREGFEVDLTKLRKLLSATNGEKNSHALYICNPNNPTSTLIHPGEVLKLCEEFPATKFIVDETYLLFRQDYDDLSLMKESSERNNLIVITSFSKFFAVPGVRIGICYSNRANVEAITTHQLPYGVNNLAQTLIPHLLGNNAFIRESREFMENERRRVYQLVKENPHLQPYEPQANFMLVRSKERGVNSTEIVDYLKQNGIVVRGGSEFLGLGNQYLRFSIRRSEDNDLLLRTINSYYNSKTKPS